MLFVLVLEALCREISLGCGDELLYADDFSLISETRKGLKGILEAWKGASERKGWEVNVKKTKMMIASEIPVKIK